MATQIKTIGGQLPWAYWSLDGDATTSLEDKSGNGRHLSKSGTPTQIADKDNVSPTTKAYGGINQANAIYRTSFGSPNFKNWTISFWYKVSINSNKSIFGFGNTTGDNNPAIDLKIYNGGNIYYYGGSDNNLFPAPTAGTWNNIIITNTTSNVRKVYLNGVLKFSGTLGIWIHYNNFYFGSGYWDSTTSDIDEVLVYESVALDGGVSVGQTALGEISQIYNAGVNEGAIVTTPTITPTTGTYTTVQTVLITCETAGSDIYYTLDGTTPNATKTLYIGSFQLSNTTTIKAIAIKNGFSNSSIATETITINIPTIIIPANYILEPDIYNYVNQFDKRVFLNFPIVKTYGFANADTYYHPIQSDDGKLFKDTLPLFNLKDFKDYLVFDNTQIYITNK